NRATTLCGGSWRLTATSKVAMPLPLTGAVPMTCPSDVKLTYPVGTGAVVTVSVTVAVRLSGVVEVVVEGTLERGVVVRGPPPAVGAKATPRNAVFAAAVSTVVAVNVGVDPSVVPPVILTMRLPLAAVVVA